eukprot:TRINITY_DN617_c0_g1_i2.p1 TRINITY_DN617_c0_g1~~TRINITY_DN617_c0_g1_i2.p1  ORF type:complete len:383 (-),score=121.11 TRINITY_DN617_c0_g1_i2:14-1162(-)
MDMQTHIRDQISAYLAQNGLVWVKDLIGELSKWVNYYYLSQPWYLVADVHRDYFIEKKPVNNKIIEVPEASEEELRKMDISLNDSILNNWEYILTQAEEITQKKSLDEVDMLKSELRRLREHGQVLKQRPIFVQHARTAIEKLTLDDAQELMTAHLDSSKRSSIINHIIRGVEQDWLDLIKRVFFSTSSAESAEEQEKEANQINPDTEIFEVWKKYEGSFLERNYQKNVSGAMKESAFMCSHGNGIEGLTPSVLGDMMWSIWNTLCLSLSNGLDRKLSEHERNILCRQVLGIQDDLIQMWLETIRNSRTGAEREGALPAKWKEEDELEKKRLEEIKKRGADAKYQAPQQSIRTPETVHHMKPEFHNLKNLLERTLEFRIKLD